MTPRARKSTICSATATASEVRRADDLVQLKQRMVGRRRFLDKNVQSGPGNFSGAKRFQQIVFVHDAAARAVDDPHAGFHFRESRAVDQSPRLVGQRHMDRDKIRPGKNLLEGHEFDP
jgi:hypothetical protein